MCYYNKVLNISEPLEILNNNSKYVKLLFLYISSSETTIEFIFYILDSFHKYEHFESDRWKDFNSRGLGMRRTAVTAQNT